jgi:hypothetical protein
MKDLYSHYLMDGRWDFACPLGEAPRRGLVVASCDTAPRVLVGFRGRWWAPNELRERLAFKRLSSQTRQWVADRIESIKVTCQRMKEVIQ